MLVIHTDAFSRRTNISSNTDSSNDYYCRVKLPGRNAQSIALTGSLANALKDEITDVLAFYSYEPSLLNVGLLPAVAMTDI